MKKLMMICGLMLGIAGFANAQQGGGQGGGQGRMMMKPEDRVKQLDEKLKLSDDQKTKLTAVFTEQVEAMKKFREEMQGGDRDAMREKMQKMRADNDAKVTAVLTDDQKKTYEAWQKEQRAEMEKRRQGGGNN
jgi:Spy/CpxP family protein refolding chaperone